MLSPYRLKKKILGINLDIEFDYFTAIFQTWQFIYEVRLRQAIRPDITNYNFIIFALRHLPSGSFISFEFDLEKKTFVQFAKNGENIMVLIPVWPTNCYKDKKRELERLLVSSKIKNSKIEWKKYSATKYDLLVNFNQNAAKATSFTLSIARYIFKFDNQEVYGYITHRLAKNPSKKDYFFLKRKFTPTT